MDDSEFEGYYRDYRVYIGIILGRYWDNGKSNGNYYLKVWGFSWIQDGFGGKFRIQGSSKT